MKKWLIGIDHKGINPCGSNYAQATSYKRRDKIINHALFMAKNKRIARVYMIFDSQWDQKACEMEPRIFSDYIMKTGERLI